MPPERDMWADKGVHGWHVLVGTGGLGNASAPFDDIRRHAFRLARISLCQQRNRHAMLRMYLSPGNSATVVQCT